MGCRYQMDIFSTSCTTVFEDLSMYDSNVFRTELNNRLNIIYILCCCHRICFHPVTLTGNLQIWSPVVINQMNEPRLLSERQQLRSAKRSKSIHIRLSEIIPPKRNSHFTVNLSSLRRHSTIGYSDRQ